MKMSEASMTSRAPAIHLVQGMDVSESEAKSFGSENVHVTTAFAYT